MELKINPIKAFFQPFIQSIHDNLNAETIHTFHPAECMPLLDVIEALHHSYYFKQPITLHFEVMDQNGRIKAFTKQGIIKTTVQENHHFLFSTDNDMCHLLSLNQIIAVY